MSNTIRLGNKVVASDPCYSIPTWCQGVFENVRPGDYVCEVVREDMGEWGMRNTKLFVIHKDYINSNKEWRPYDTVMGVDSGQFGIFDFNSYMQASAVKDVPKWGTVTDDDFYSAIVHLTLETKDKWGMIEAGVVTSSGYGDGSYDLNLLEDNNEIVGFGISFA